mmetsp:Transcript_18268/g.40345  ORF Transcript_18268/g.40345 Transcript_18268/m.40345 type:complete len:272 (+) Transcript_18268:290-1105(+)
MNQGEHVTSQVRKHLQNPGHSHWQIFGASQELERVLSALAFQPQLSKRENRPHHHLRHLLPHTRIVPPKHRQVLSGAEDSDVPGLKAGPQRGVKRISWKRRHGQTESDHSKMGGNTDEVPHLLRSFFEPQRTGQKPAILQLHLAVLQQIVQGWQHIPFSLLDTIQYEHPALERSPDGSLVHPLECTSYDLTPLLQVILSCVPGQSYVFNLAAQKLTNPECETTPQRARRPDEESILTNLELFQQPQDRASKLGGNFCSRAKQHRDVLQGPR